MKAKHQPAARWVDQLGPEKIDVGAEHFGIKIGEELFGCEKRSLVFGYAMNLETADNSCLHDPLRNFHSRFAGSLRRTGGAVDSASRRSGFDEVEPTLDQGDVAGHPIDPARDVGVLRLDQTQPLLDFDQIGLHFRDIAANGAEVFED